MRKDVMKIGAAVLAACMLAGCGGQNTGTQSNPTGDTSAAGSQSAPAEGGEKVVTLANSIPFRPTGTSTYPFCTPSMNPG